MAATFWAAVFVTSSVGSNWNIESENADSCCTDAWVSEPRSNASCSSELSVPAVKSRLLRARLQLRERLGRYFQRREGGSRSKDVQNTDMASGDGDL